MGLDYSVARCGFRQAPLDLLGRDKVGKKATMYRALKQMQGIEKKSPQMYRRESHALCLKP
ncbi:hypothetical protein JY97_06875 [Alkalispirochaeta odontotermitis]|nr:hypothetical protein JY97_06875 [Alkalispirochaeta odontotermitis]